MTARLGVALLGLCLVVPNSAVAARRQTLEAIDGFVEERMAAARLPGLALAIVQGDRVVHLRGFGEAAPDGTPVTPETPFVIGSLSKAVTALAVMKLVQTKRVHLNDPVEGRLPWLQHDVPDEARIRVLHLLRHTSGFSAMEGRRFFEGRAGSLADLLQSYRSLRPIRPPGVAFEYSNVNYNLLAALVERVSGEPYAAFVKRRIFEPLDMKGSFLDEAPARAAGLAVGHRYWYGRPVAADDLPYLPGYVPSAYVVSTAEDLAHFLIAQLNGGRYGDTRLLRGASIQMLQRPAVDTGDGRGHYAMGWFVTEWDRTRVVWHPGDVPNYRAAAVLAPEEGWGLALLMNASSVLDAAELDAIAPGVLAILEGREPPQPGGRGLYLLLLVAAGLLLAFQLAGVVAWLVLLVRRPAGPRLWRVTRLAAALVLDLVVAGFVLALPYVFQVPLRTLLVYQPDVAKPYLAILALALGWGALRTALGALRELRV